MPSTALGAGVIGAVLGTLGGYHARRRLVAARMANPPAIATTSSSSAIGRSLPPVALLEDVVAIAGGFAILAATGHVLTDYLLTAVK
ncbi:hypothetical protein MAHJHV45_48460 [Mycobacterium avium subsp. hominissuis]